MTFVWNIVFLIKQPADFFVPIKEISDEVYDNDFPSSVLVFCKPPQPHPGSHQVQVSSV